MNTLLLELCVAAHAVTAPCEGVLLPADVAKEALVALEVTIPKLELDLMSAAKRYEILVSEHDAVVAAHYAEIERKDAAFARQTTTLATCRSELDAAPGISDMALAGVIGAAVGAVAGIVVVLAM